MSEEKERPYCLIIYIVLIVILNWKLGEVLKTEPVPRGTYKNANIHHDICFAFNTRIW